MLFDMVLPEVFNVHQLVMVIVEPRGSLCS